MMKMDLIKPDSYAIFKIIAIYAIFSFLWIYFSDTALGFLISSPATITRISVFKGFLFVIVSSLLIYQLISRYLLESRQLKKTIKNKDQLFNYLSEGMIDAFCSVDMTGKILQFNEVFRSMLGYEAVELLSKTYFDLTPEKWHSMERKSIEEQVIPRGYSEIYEKEYRKKDGTVFPIELRTQLIRDEDGNPSIMWAIVHDITERKRTEKELRESEILYRSILTASPDDITITDMEGHIIMYSPAALTMFRGNQDEEQQLGRLVTDFIAPEDRERAMSNAVLRLQGKSIGSQEYRGLRLDGSTFEMEVNTEFIRDTEGQAIKMVYIVRDITERKRSEEELKKKNAEIEQFIYTVSHDLRSPLVTVKTFMDTLKKTLTKATRNNSPRTFSLLTMQPTK